MRIPHNKNSFSTVTVTSTVIVKLKFRYNRHAHWDQVSVAATTRTGLCSTLHIPRYQYVVWKSDLTSISSFCLISHCQEISDKQTRDLVCHPFCKLRTDQGPLGVSLGFSRVFVNH